MIECSHQFIRVNDKEINDYSSSFEDNAGTLQLVTAPTHRHRTKHACVKHHHFRQCVKSKTISIRAIDAHDQHVDFFMKPLASEKLKNFCKLIMGW